MSDRDCDDKSHIAFEQCCTRWPSFSLLRNTLPRLIIWLILVKFERVDCRIERLTVVEKVADLLIYCEQILVQNMCLASGTRRRRDTTSTARYRPQIRSGSTAWVGMCKEAFFVVMAKRRTWVTPCEEKKYRPFSAEFIRISSKPNDRNNGHQRQLNSPSSSFHFHAVHNSINPKHLIKYYVNIATWQRETNEYIILLKSFESGY